MSAPRLALRLLLWTAATWVSYWLLALLLGWVARGDASQGLITLLGYGLIYATFAVVVAVGLLFVFWGLNRVMERF